MKELTTRQQEILNFLKTHFKNNAYWPSIRGIQEHFGFKSTNAVMGHLRALESKGMLSRVPGQARAYQMISRDPTEPEHNENLITIPIYGSIAAGYPDLVESGEAIGSLQFDTTSSGVKNKTQIFALKVRGDSMIDAGILEGDVVVVEKTEPRSNDIVVALIDGESTLKRFIQEKGARPFLRAENANYPDMHPLSELMTQGVVRSVLRCL